MIWQLIRLEAHRLLRQPVAQLLVGLYLLLILAAAVNGARAMERALEAHAKASAEAQSASLRMAARLARPMPPEDAVLTPVRVRSAILMPVPRLVDFSIGRTGFESASADAGLRSRPETLFRQIRLDNPALLARGSLDLGLVAVVTAPLLLVVLGAGLYAPDRETGVARLALVEAGNARRLLVARSVPPVVLAVAPVLLAASWLLATGPALPGRLAAAAAWLSIVFLWLVLCWTAMLALHSRRIGGETAAFIGVAGWAIITLVLPAVLVMLAGLLHPPPSRFAEIAAARAAEVRATQKWDNDHAELAGEEAATRLASLRRGLAIAAATDAAVAPIRAEFNETLDAQQAFVRTSSWIAPPLAVALALEDVAATGTAAHAEFRAAADRHLAALQSALGRYVLEGRGLSPADLARIPRFEWRAPHAPVLPVLVYLAALVGLSAAYAVWGYRRPLLS